jgi:TRAP transporter TAXI family solute receptor
MPPMFGQPASRRTVLRAIGALGLVAALPACASTYSDLRLTVATGSRNGVYFALGGALATAWRDALGMRTPPVVTSTDGSINNLQLLADRKADVAFNQIDTAADRFAHSAAADPASLRALARIYDDVVHVVVPASSSLTSLEQLRGARVALGSEGSGVLFMAQRVLQALGISPDKDLKAVHIGLDASVVALREGGVDAFFWSGGLPTLGVADLAASMPIRLLNLQEDLTRIHAAYPEYAPGTVPAGTYGLAQPVTTLLLRNVLLVRADMADDVAYSLVAALFTRQEQIAQSSPNALTIDMRAAIGTQPVPLHPGAERWFRQARNG